MKLIIQVPCYNEGDTLEATLAALPRTVEGVDAIEVLVIDDGSSDDTVEVARRNSVDHIVSHAGNRGLAATFQTGLSACLRLGADVIVNTDGDNQYSGKDIEKLVTPIVRGEADLVIGDRQTETIEHFSPSKKLLQKWGSFVVRQFSGTSVPDVVSGFRAWSREAALKTNIVSPFSYTIESIIQAGNKRLRVHSVPVDTNASTRQSRLAKSTAEFVGKSATTTLRMYAMHQAMRVFFAIGFLLAIVGVIPILRFLYFYFTSGGAGHVQSLVIGGALLVMGFLTLLLGLIADLISCNRRLLEMVLENTRRIPCETGDIESMVREHPNRAFSSRDFVASHREYRVDH